MSFKDLGGELVGEGAKEGKLSCSKWFVIIVIVITNRYKFNINHYNITLNCINRL